MDRQPQPRQPALSLRSLILLALFLTAGALWVRQASLVSYTCQVAEGTPSVPALTALILLGALALAVPRLRRAGWLRRESLMIYLILSLALPMSCANVMRQLFPALTAMRYFAAPENSYAEFAEYVPCWLAPGDDEAIRQFYEGSDGAPIPWSAWRLPLATWAAIFLVYSLSLYCLVALFRKPWAEHERLTFPLAELALQVAPGGTAAHSSRPLLMHGLFWAGFTVSALLNLTNGLHAFQPQVVALGSGYELGALLTQRPWSGLRPLYLAHRPEIIGLGYLVPVDILFSSWLFHLVLRFENFGAQVIGYTQAGFPYEWPQGFGAYLGLAAALAYSARGHLKQVLATATGRPAVSPAVPPSPVGRGIEGEGCPVGRQTEGERMVDEPVPCRLALWGFLAGLLALITMFTAAGMSPVRAAVYIGLSYTMALVYSKIRAQTGVPISYVVPRRDVPLAIFDLTPTGLGLSATRVRQETNFAVLTVLNRKTFPHIAAFETEGIRLADRARVRRTHLFASVVIGIAAGPAIGYATHLTADYGYGCNVLDGGTTEGDGGPLRS